MSPVSTLQHVTKNCEIRHSLCITHLYSLAFKLQKMHFMTSFVVHVTFHLGLLLWYVISQSWIGLSTQPSLHFQISQPTWMHQGHRTEQKCLVPNGYNGSGHQKDQTLEPFQGISPYPFYLHISVPYQFSM